ncbi:helix-turn-helix domain-containing protein [Sphingomonas sp. MMSM20]|uniref:IclR family transcriptional regulator n=1 Tax=Sphingomonas lycopersici TaxID=2951807 RepID=UPI0022384DD7|nr:helix-turn-helix domain-containing protein [Sphingomonas lycopersici]MCW6532181.1 helix-turn-helix domain-containing protein [Sphingomonas lycopersici]
MTGPVRSVSQALGILRLLAETSPMSLSDIARVTGLSPSSCLNLLKTLVDEGVVERDARTKSYRLARAWAASEALRDGAGQGLVDRAQPLITQFARRHDAAVALWKVISRERVRAVSRAESEAGMRVAMADGQRQPLGGGAVGRALAAAQRVAPDELARRFEPVRWQAPLSLADYAAQVETATARGYAVDDGFAFRGICTVAVAIAGVMPGFCLSASMFAGRTPAEVAALGEELVGVRDALLRG